MYYMQVWIAAGFYYAIPAPRTDFGRNPFGIHWLLLTFRLVFLKSRQIKNFDPKSAHILWDLSLFP